MSQASSDSLSARSPADAASGRPRRGPLAWCALAGAVAFAGFLELFALDLPVFSLGFVMQSLPAIVVLTGAALGWWRSWAGAAWLGAAAIFALVYFGPWRHWTWPLAINLPPLLLAGMFALDALRRGRRERA